MHLIHPNPLEVIVDKGKDQITQRLACSTLGHISQIELYVPVPPELQFLGLILKRPP